MGGAGAGPAGGALASFDVPGPGVPQQADAVAGPGPSAAVPPTSIPVTAVKDLPSLKPMMPPRVSGAVPCSPATTAVRLSSAFATQWTAVRAYRAETTDAPQKTRVPGVDDPEYPGDSWTAVSWPLTMAGAQAGVVVTRFRAIARTARAPVRPLVAKASALRFGMSSWNSPRAGPAAGRLHHDGYRAPGAGGRTLPAGAGNASLLLPGPAWPEPGVRPPEE
ncbi:Hypothetical protein SCLAV_p0038 (plasmid) [Streptomyces clavuligerus]|uniref:Uncharacterized protein n=1 Tax=Streptomyces clavuligerus TaxID=1901 RepID=D5SHZ0_STRCL|nr:Hypothetical protein SCLAV_p0038 [Streptomyces clavuligerus]